MNNKIYVIMVMHDINVEIGDRIPGYYFDKDIAFEAVKNNWCDVWETCYNYALIEEIEEGLYKSAAKGHRWWFKFNLENKQYEEIDEPECMKKHCGFTIG